ncbi:GNAT family N-acetyltransferase [Streptococcus oricebi]|uniref:GNAT family N-acetyltransferase n=1 Tax=Streptococcus oricebi TaxID=1547447 RepID=A0ABS5B286_9STRE|nr:GNAT family N-acetyltransferase [Streptococcus oricebi]MBP2622952.1 GNAT family N-acetyltransferase [Streptococcus oricebi]
MVDVYIISLSDLLAAVGDEESKSILQQFKGRKADTSTPHDVEVFLHKKAIDFERSAISTTHLVFEAETNLLLGFFSLTMKPLKMNKKNFEKLSNTRKKKLLRIGRRTSDQKYEVNGYLIGQLGKNHIEEIDQKITGNELLTLAYKKVKEASQIIRCKYVWLECEDTEKLISFYTKFGFSEVEDYISKNNLKIMIMKLD